MSDKQGPSSCASTRSARSRLFDPVDDLEKMIQRSQDRNCDNRPKAVSDPAASTLPSRWSKLEEEPSSSTRLVPEVKLKTPPDEKDTVHSTMRQKELRLVDDPRDCMDTLIQRTVPNAVIETLNDHVLKPAFLELIVQSLARLTTTWVEQPETVNPLKVYIDTELERQVTDYVSPKYVLVPRTDSLDQPQVLEERDQPTFLPVLQRGEHPPDDDPSGDNDNYDLHEKSRKIGKEKRRSRRKKKSRKDRVASSDSEGSDDLTDGDENSTTTETDSESSEDIKPRKCKRKSTKANLQVFKPLNDWYVKACSYKSYRMSNRSAKYSSRVAEKIVKYRKRLEPQMKTRTFEGQDPVTKLSFLHWFQKACDQCGVSEDAAVWCFQFFLTGQAYDLLQSRVGGGSKAVDTKRAELLRSYPEVLKFLITIYVAYEVISEEYNSLMQYRQSTGMTEQDSLAESVAYKRLSNG